MSAEPAPVRSFVAIGDSFTEGVGDDVTLGPLRRPVARGWADLAAGALADAQGHSVRYANLAIRGRKLGAILAEQLQPAIDLAPDIISLNGGGNDILRPRVSVAWASGMLEDAAARIAAAGIRPVIVSGADPSALMPLGSVFRKRGTALNDAVDAWSAREGYVRVDNWSDADHRDAAYWDEDRLHMSPRGHARAAARFVRALGFTPPADWGLDDPVRTVATARDAQYYRTYVGPWIGRRLTGRSSGDFRSAKHPTFIELQPTTD